MNKKSIIWYLTSLVISFLASLILLLILFLINDASVNDFWERLPSITSQFIRTPLFWILISLPYFTIRLFKFWILGFKEGGFKKFITRFSYSFILPSSIILLLVRWSIWHQNSEKFDYDWDDTSFNLSDSSRQFHLQDEKIRGMHVFGKLDSTNLKKLLPANIEHIVLVPYANQEDYNSPAINYKGRNQLRRDSVYSLIINLSKSAGLRVIIKPHIWITNPTNGKWRADIEMESEKEWKEWEYIYEEFILQYARLSERHNLPYFCIGNEYYVSTTQRPEFWISLIGKVRNVYSGKLIYGANWDREFQAIQFWDKLDLIGVQAYFPLADTSYPDYSTVRDGWNKHLVKLDSIHKVFGKKIVFTEIGYKSTPDAAQFPWGWEKVTENIFQRISTKTQAYCYEAFFEKVWTQDWMAGVMIWQWQTSERDNNGNHNFTPEGKPAFNEIAKGFNLVEKYQ